MKTKTILAIGLFLTLLEVCPAQTSFTNGLVAYYPLNGNANDASGNGHNGIIYGASLATDRFGQTNSAYAFDGQTSYIDAGVVLTRVDVGTYSAWFNQTTPRNITESIIAKDRNPTGDGFGLGYLDGHISGFLNREPGVFQAPYGVGDAIPTSDGNWHQAVVTSDGNILNLYVDGQPVATLGLVAGSFASTQPIWIGRSFATDPDGGGVRAFYGLIDDVRIYNRALSSNDVAALYSFESLPSKSLVSQLLTNSAVIVGQSATFGVVASSQTPLSFQWYCLPANNGGQAGAYVETIGGSVQSAVVTNGGFGYGNVPEIHFVGGGGNGAGAYATVSNGVVTGITITNAGSGYGSVPAVAIDPPNGWLYGQTDSSLTISNAGPNNLGNYFVVVSNAGGSVTSSVVSLTLLYPPSIARNPSGLLGSLRSSNTLSVVAAGTLPFGYQWFFNGTNLPNATNSSYSISSLNLTNAGEYSVQVTNAYGSIASLPADVELLPSLTSPFIGAVGLWGQDTMLNVGAVGSGALNFQWYFNGVAIPGATGSNYVVGAIQFTNAGLYNVVVGSPYGSVTNAAYQVVVNPANTALGTCPEIYITGTIGYTYTIQSSTDLANTNAWVTLTNLTLGAASIIWADTATDLTKSANPKKFYRVLPGK